jgi:hypothetical protein
VTRVTRAKRATTIGAVIVTRVTRVITRRVRRVRRVTRVTATTATTATTARNQIKRIVTLGTMDSRLRGKAPCPLVQSSYQSREPGKGFKGNTFCCADSRLGLPGSWQKWRKQDLSRCGTLTAFQSAASGYHSCFTRSSTWMHMASLTRSSLGPGHCFDQERRHRTDERCTGRVCGALCCRMASLLNTRLRSEPSWPCSSSVEVFRKGRSSK